MQIQWNDFPGLQFGQSLYRHGLPAQLQLELDRDLGQLLFQCLFEIVGLLILGAA